jgi:hypothetical protein
LTPGDPRYSAYAYGSSPRVATALEPGDWEKSGVPFQNPALAEGTEFSAGRPPVQLPSEPFSEVSGPNVRCAATRIARQRERRSRR